MLMREGLQLTLKIQRGSESLEKIVTTKQII